MVVREGSGEQTWWTFAGQAVNASLAAAFSGDLADGIRHDNFAIRFQPGAEVSGIEASIHGLVHADPARFRPPVDADAIASLKFRDCLPPQLAEQLLTARTSDEDGLRTVLNEPVRFVTVS